ncbi:MAG: CPBP family intramembrane glutamic endopeptidase [Myxococcota bacterium]
MIRQSAYPGPFAATIVCLAAWFATGLCIVVIAPDIENLEIGILGISQAIGMGLVTSLAARRVPEPQAERLGLRAFEWHWLWPIALLLPLSVVVSELVNLAHALYPPPDAELIEEMTRERVSAEGFLGILEVALVVVGIAPVVEEWLYRGLIQQGLVMHMGRAAGVLATACLFGLAHFQPGYSVAASVGTFLAVLPLGVVLGMVRIATGSLLAPILFHAGYNAVSVAGISLAEQLPIAGFNAPGDHTPLEIWLPCAVAAAFGVVPFWRGARDAPPEPALREIEEPDSGPPDWMG